MFATKFMNHTEYPKLLKKKDNSQLLFIIEDAISAMNAYPDNPNNSYYQDEVNYCANELRRRKITKKTVDNWNWEKMFIE